MTLATYPMNLRQARAVAAPPRPHRSLTQALILHHADVVRAGVSSLLSSESGWDVAAAASIYDAFRLAATNHPQLVLFDFTATDGPETARLFAGLWPRPRLVALVGGGESIVARDCLRAGADGAIAIDNVNRESFLVALRRVLDGVPAVTAGFPVPGEPSRVDLESGPAAVLTPREREMLFLIGEGLSNREIAEALTVSIKTVEAHRANLSRKLNIRSRAGLMRLALTGSLA